MYDMPSGQAVMPINKRMVESLRELHNVLQDYPNAGNFLSLADDVEAGGSLDPEAYGAYYRLVRGVQSPNSADLRRLISQLARCNCSHGIAIRMLSIKEFGREGMQQTRAEFASDSLLQSQIGAVPANAHPKMRRNLQSALDLIAQHAPNAWTDLTRVTSEIVATFGVPRGVMSFDGCSSLERYGSILVNIKRTRSPLILAETLVHESAHSLLFGLTCNDLRVLNPQSERYASPLRIDPRPLDGIYHAVFVLARMHGFAREVTQNSKTTKAMRAEAKNLLALRRKSFLDGHAVLEQNARLTDIGRLLLDEAYANVTKGN